MKNSTGTQSLHVQIPLVPDYENKYVQIKSTQINFQLELKEGHHTTTSEPVVVGTVANFTNPALLASITVWYNFETATNVLTLCSSDLVSDDATYLTTVPEGSNQFGNQRTYYGDEFPCGTNPNWNYTTPLTPGLEEALQNTVRKANDLIIEKALEQGLTVIVRTPMPVIPADLYEKLSAVYYNGEFVEMYDPNKVYGNDYSIFHIDSTWYGEIYLNKNENFANVIGSTHDPKIAGKSWLQLWQSQFGQAQTCTSLYYQGFSCSGGLVGGHSVLGTVAKSMPKGSNKVFIMPICTAHNNNDNVYMAAIMYTKGIALHNYLGH